MEEFEKLVKNLNEEKIEKMDELTLQMIKHFGYEGEVNLLEIEKWTNENGYSFKCKEQSKGDMFNTRNCYFICKDDKELAMFLIETILDLENMKMEVLYTDVIYMEDDK